MEFFGYVWCWLLVVIVVGRNTYRYVVFRVVEIFLLCGSFRVFRFLYGSVFREYVLRVGVALEFADTR